MNEVFIIDALRTAVGSLNGALAGTPAVELGRIVLDALLRKHGLAGEAVDEVILGCVLQAGLGQNVARQSAIAAGIPVHKTAMTVNMVCGSGLRAVTLAAAAIRSGEAQVMLAGGTENMSAAPYLLPKARGGYRLGHDQLVDGLIQDGLQDVFNKCHMGITAENLAAKYGITRQQQDEFAATSQQRAQAAIAAGRFKDEILPVLIPQRKGDPIRFEQDEFPRPGTTVEKLAALKPAFKPDGTVTAGNASGINDGAAAALLAGQDACRRYSLRPMARVVSWACAGVDPAVMGIGPVQAVRKALDLAGWRLADVQLIEANEAFAAQSLALAKELGWDLAIVNVNGGAIALGHPIGASGARILTTLLYEMKRRSVRKGLVTLCIGGGMGIAACVEMV
ncbi:MAG: acetyl-CoA C-acetyltransferase [Sedimentisphaerales bacterium]|nr:acetyl-CoA C-acetyltransferase [Sedimentisphaerales bacterium]